MRCGYCGHIFSEDEGITGCGKCGKPGKCSMIRCPRCYYENPPELKFIRKLKAVIGKNENKD